MAERLFVERGYASVTLRDIAAALGIRQASLYHHVPGGKEELFLAVVDRAFARHRTAMWAAVSAHEGDLRAQLCAAAQWLLSQPPVDLARLARSDALAVAGVTPERITQPAYEALMVPVQRAVVAAMHRGDILPREPDLVAGAFLAMIDGLFTARRHVDPQHLPAAETLIDILLDGLRPRR